MTTSRIRRSLVLALAVAGIPSQVLAQADYPNKPIVWVVPFATGGPTDALARLIAERVARELKQPIVIENTPGAGGTIGAAKVAKAKNDGYTFLVGHMGYMGAAPALYKKLSYDPIKDFDTAFRFPDTPLVLMVRNDHPAKTIQEFISYSKANPDKVFIGNAGVGSSSHLIAALFSNAVGMKHNSVAYKGAGPALIDVIGGQVDGMFDQANTALPQLEAKKVRALAVTSKVRLAQLKDIPTVAETALPGFEASTWYGIYAPKGTPKPVLVKVQAAYLQVMKDKEFTGKMVAQAIHLLPTPDYSAENFSKHTENEVARWRAVVVRSGLTIE